MVLKSSGHIHNPQEERSSVSFITIQNMSGKGKKCKVLCVIVEAKIH